MSSKLKLHSFKGCHMCPQRFGCDRLIRVSVEVTFLKDKYEFFNGKEHLTFTRGQTVVGRAVFIDRKVFCIRAESSLQPDLGEIYLSLKFIRVHIPKIGVISHMPGMQM